MKRPCTILAVSYLLLGVVSAQAENPRIIHIGRYQTITNKPLVAQKDLLSQIKRVIFTSEVTTVGQALQIWLQSSGYCLAPLNTLSNAAKTLLSLPLPAVDRQLGPLSLRLGLETLVGDDYRLVIDSIHRQISFTLKRSVDKTDHHSPKAERAHFSGAPQLSCLDNRSLCHD